jgi:GT2 family glycosyltransferase
MSHRPRASIVIPTFRRRDSVGRALQALARQTVPAAEFEVIVALNGPEDGTTELVSGFAAPFALRTVYREQAGRAGACNQGIAAATGELIVLLDDDMEPGPGFVAAHQAAHHAPRLGVVGAAPVVVGPGSPPVAKYIAARFERHGATLAAAGYRFRLRDFYSGNFSIAKADLPSTGPFDETFTEYGNEDLELSRRLVQSGVRLVYCAEALAYQHYEKDFPRLARDTMAKGRTAVLFARKHPAVLPDLKLSAYEQVSIRHRALRAGLLGLARIWGRTPDVVLALVGWVERRQPARLHKIYSTVLDYFYWLGVQTAKGDAPR